MTEEQPQSGRGRKSKKIKIQRNAGSRNRSGSEGTAYGKRSKKRDDGKSQRR